METSNESFALLQLIANDCYSVGAFYFAAKAFDVLESIDPNPEYWEGKRGACIGVFRKVLAGQVRDSIIGHTCAQQYVGKSQSCMVTSGRFIVHARLS